MLEASVSPLPTARLGVRLRVGSIDASRGCPRTPTVAAEAARAEEPAPEQIEQGITVSRALEEPLTPFGEALRRFFIDDQLPAGPV
jgi:hypothetical protein